MSKYFEKCKTYKAKLMQQEFDKWFETHIEKNKCNINYSDASGEGGNGKSSYLVLFQCSVEKLKLGVF